MTENKSWKINLVKVSGLLQPFLAVVCLATVSALPPNKVHAQDKPASHPKTEAASVEANTQGYDLEIADGKLVHKGRRLEASLGNVLDALRDRYPKANIVMSPGMSRLSIADLKLRAGHLADELEALRVASGGRFEFTGPSGPNPPIDPSTGLPLAGATDLNAGLFILREPRPTAETQRMVEAFNVGPYLAWLVEQEANELGLKAAHPDPTNYIEQIQKIRLKAASEGPGQIKSIIADTIKSLKQGEFNAADEPGFQFHQGANLLVVVGTREAVEVARKVVDALPGQVTAPGPTYAETLRRRYGVVVVPPPGPGVSTPPTPGPPQ